MNNENTKVKVTGWHIRQMANLFPGSEFYMKGKKCKTVNHKATRDYHRALFEKCQDSSGEAGLIEVESLRRVMNLLDTCSQWALTEDGVLFTTYDICDEGIEIERATQLLCRF